MPGKAESVAELDVLDMDPNLPLGEALKRMRDSGYAIGRKGQLASAPASVDVPIDVGPPPAALLKLDFGCGPNPKDGFDGVDAISFDGKVKHVMDVVARSGVGHFLPWPWSDASVEEAHASHFIEHLDALERVHFFNELYRVLVPGGKATVIVPHWSSCRAYGDPTHKWPPVSEFAWFYLLRDWRLGNPTQKCPCSGNNKTCGQCQGKGTFAQAANAPHTDKKHWSQGYDCDFDAQGGYSMHQNWVSRNQETQQFAMQWYKEACQDSIVTLTKK